MAILGGDDAGGGVQWAPQVIEDARAHGLILGTDGKLYDTKAGQSLPAGIDATPVLTDTELASYPEYSSREVVTGFVPRYWDLTAMADEAACNVIGADGILKDKPGFEVDLVNRDSVSTGFATPVILQVQLTGFEFADFGGFHG